VPATSWRWTCCARCATGDAAGALAHELAPLCAAGSHLAARVDAALHDVDGGCDEAQARTLARRLALLLQAALLRQHATDAVFDAFTRSRIDAANDVFGLLPAGVDLAAIIARESRADGLSCMTGAQGVPRNR
jgi:putative acyl-CoA dehydrogenase